MLNLADSESAPQVEETSRASEYQLVSLLYILVQETLLVEPRNWMLGFQHGTNSVLESCSWHGGQGSRLAMSTSSPRFPLLSCMRVSNRTDLSSRDFSSGLDAPALLQQLRARCLGTGSARMPLALDKKMELSMGQCAHTCVSDSFQGSVGAPGSLSHRGD